MTADSPAEGLTSAAALERLARAYGVATRYDDADGVPHAVAPETVVAVLASFGVDASTPRSAADAVADHLRQRSSRVLPPVVVVRSGQPASTIARVTPGTRAQAQVTTDAGAVIGCSTPAGPGPAPADASADLPPRHQQVIRIPALPPGWHQLSVQAGAESRSCTLLATPPGGARRPERRRRWGWAAQLYALPSSTSWGIGDLADLAELASVSGREFGADLVVCNPLHAGALTRPVEDSPYSPSSRQFHNPIYLRVDATPEYRAAPPDVRRLVDAHRPDVGADLIDRERVWRAKQAALEMLFEQSDPALRAERLHRARAEHGPAVDTFALFSAAAERYGRRWPDWPAGLRSADDALVPALRAQLAGRIDFHVWLQALCREQLLAAAEAARAGGMAVGIVHDLAVGVDPGGADAWARPDLLVRGMTIGAPPDGFYSAG
ncbi:MAG TPA: 4-alpha-glucanotransferase, partial [Kineosporiaceae bacterium]